MRRVRDHWRLALVALLGAMLALGGVAWVVRAPWRGAAPVERGTATFVGRQACASCHPEQDRLWRGSDHDLAMQVADEPSILGDFGDATFTHRGVTSRFFRRDGKFFARTEGPDGRLQDFPIAYAFGVRPLQQYLIAFPGGRYQALGIAWDTRARAVGGQRWFALDPGERIRPGDPLHWTGVTARRVGEGEAGDGAARRRRCGRPGRPSPRSAGRSVADGRGHRHRAPRGPRAHAA